MFSIKTYTPHSYRISVFNKESLHIHMRIHPLQAWFILVKQ